MAAAGAVGAALGIALMAGGALLLYSDEGFLRSAGFLMAVGMIGVAAGLWVGAPDGPAPADRRTLRRWMLAIIVMVVASFAAMVWFRVPALQTSLLGPPLALVVFMAEPAYALGALLAALEARRGDAAVPALIGSAAGVVVAAVWLIPALPPGPVFLAAALLLAAAGTMEMGLGGASTEGAMAERVVLITGVGGRGQVGYALAEAFHRRGARLVLAGRSDEVDARATELGGEVVAVRADLTTEDGSAAAVAAARERWGRLDTVVNAAGGLRVVKPLGETTASEWSDEIDRNALTAFLVSRAALPLLRESRGSIINFASPAADRAVPRLGAYGAAKAGVAALTRSLAVEERRNGVRVNAVAPGLIDTAQNRESVEDPDGTAWVTREAVAETVLFLAEASGVSGEVVRVTHSA